MRDSSMEVAQLQRKYREQVESLFQEGFLDENFTELKKMQDGSNPTFIVELVSMFIRDFQRLLDDLTRDLDQRDVDYRKVANYIHQLKGSSSSMGAGRVRDACIALRYSCDQHNTEACITCLQQVRQEYSLVKNKLEDLIRLEKQIVEAGGAVPIL